MTPSPNGSDGPQWRPPPGRSYGSPEPWPDQGDHGHGRQPGYRQPGHGQSGQAQRAYRQPGHGQWPDPGLPGHERPGHAQQGHRQRPAWQGFEQPYGRQGHDGDGQAGDVRYGAPPSGASPARGLPDTAGTSPWRRYGLLAGAALVIGGLAYGTVSVLHGPSAAEVGECMAGKDADDLRLVDCTDPKATYTVAGRIEGKTEVDLALDKDICTPYLDGEGYQYWEGKKGEAGVVLCLKPKK